MSSLVPRAALVLVVLFSSAVHARFGDQDCSFGVNGVQTIGDSGNAYAAIVESSGNVLVQMGSPVTTGGMTRWVTTVYRIDAQGTTAQRLFQTDFEGTDQVDVVQPDGGILFATGTGIVTGSVPGVGRVLPSGALDASFGNGGYATIASLESAMAGPLLQLDGRIIVGGRFNNASALVRFNANGSLDTTFGSGGVALNPVAHPFGYRSIAFEPDGSIVALHAGGLSRHLPTGQLDSAFGGGGNVGLDAGTTPLQVRVQPSGKILVLGERSTGTLALYPYTTSGLGSGHIDVEVGSMVSSGVSVLFRASPPTLPLSLMADGRPIVVGASGIGGHGLVARFSVDLQRPTSASFSAAGETYASTPFTPTFITVLPSGKLLVGEQGANRLYRRLGDSNIATCVPTTTALSSSPNPSLIGQPFRVTAVVSAADGSTPSGIVEFFENEFSLESDVVPLGQVALSAGSATIEYPSRKSVPGGVYLSAHYVGAGVYGFSSNSDGHIVTDFVSIADASANSANGNTMMSFTVTLAAPMSVPAKVAYSTSDGTATKGADYFATSGSLTFDPFETTKTINIPIVGQLSPRSEKDFFVTLSPVSNADITRGTAVGRIFYTSPPPAFSIDDPFVAEGYSGATLLAFTVTLSQRVPTAVSVSYATSDGSAVAAMDYVPVSGTLTFAAGQSKRFILVPVLGNATPQSNRTFTVTLSNSPGGTTLGKAQGTGTILDDDPTPAATTTTQFRLYHPGTFEHLYTTDANEYAVLSTRGWRPEGKAYTIFNDGGAYGSQHAVPLYRLYLSGILQHHWTTDANEAKVLADSHGWEYEGITAYLLPAAEAGTMPLYRLNLAKPPLHLWTTDANEKDALTSKYSWKYEGIAGYVLP